MVHNKPMRFRSKENGLFSPSEKERILKIRQFLVLCGFSLIFLTTSCITGSTIPATTSTTILVTTTLPESSTGQDFLQEAEGINVKLDVFPEEGSEDWIARVDLHSIEKQEGLRLSISSRSSRQCKLEIKDKTQTPPPSESSPTTLSWDLDIQKNQSLMFTVFLGNCDTKSEGLVAELYVGAMMQNTTIIYDFATIFMYEDRWQVVYAGTPWPTPTYDPLLPEIPQDFDEESTPTWMVGTPIVTPSDVVTTLIFELTKKAYQTPTPIGTIQSPAHMHTPRTPTLYP